MGQFAATAPLPAVKACPVGRLMETLDKDDRAAVASATMDPDISIRRVIDWLRDNGVSMTKDTVSAHRAGKCRCVA